MKILLVVFVVYSFAEVFAGKARFDNYKLLGLNIKNVDQLNVIKSIENSVSEYVFWSDINLGREVDVMVPPHKIPEIRDILNSLQIKFTVKVDNVQE